MRNGRRGSAVLAFCSFVSFANIPNKPNFDCDLYLDSGETRPIKIFIEDTDQSKKVHAIDGFDIKVTLSKITIDSTETYEAEMNTRKGSDMYESFPNGLLSRLKLEESDLGEAKEYIVRPGDGEREAPFDSTIIFSENPDKSKTDLVYTRAYGTYKSHAYVCDLPKD